jgi:YesN/AraC family two-component response regulator
MLKVVIVDDEPDAVKFIQGIISEYCPNIEVAGTANSARDGVSVITQAPRPCVPRCPDAPWQRF